jgi:trimeric autotransporter adhesin
MKQHRLNSVSKINCKNSRSFFNFKKVNAKNLLLLFFIVLAFTQAQAQSVGIAATASTPDASSILDVKSTTKGMLIPRMTTTEKNAIPAKATGLMLYDNTLNQFSYWNGTAWVNVAGGSGAASQWTTTGSHIYYDAGNVGINRTNPSANLDVLGSFRYLPFGGSPAVGKIMTSDANGYATWELPSYANTWTSDGFGNSYHTSLTGKVFVGNNNGSGDNSKFIITTPTNAVGLTHTDGAIKLSTITGNRTGATIQNGGWFGTSTNNPLMLMTNDVEALKIKPSGVMEIGYNYLSAPVHDWGMLDVNSRLAGSSNTLGIFGKNYGLSIQANPAAIGFNHYTDPSASNVSKIITTGNAARNIFDASLGNLDWQTFPYSNANDAPAGAAEKIMSLSTTVTGPAGGGSQVAGENRLTVFTQAPSAGTPSPSFYGFLHKQSNVEVGTKISYDAVSGITNAGIGTKSNHDLKLFANNNFANAITLNTSGNVGIGTSFPSNKLTVSGSANVTNNMTISGNELISGNSNVSGNVAIGSTGYYATTKLYVAGSNTEFPLVAYAGNAAVSIKTNGITNSQALIGSATNHDLGLFTNNGAASVTLKTNGELNTQSGIYSAQTTGLNIVPIGVIKMDETISYPNNGFYILNAFYTNEVGSLGYGGFGKSFPGVDDELYFDIYLNPAITNNYTKVIVVGTPGFNNVVQSAAIYKAQAKIVPSLNFNNPAGTGGLSLRIEYYGDNLNNIVPSGTYMIYGIK